MPAIRCIVSLFLILFITTSLNAQQREPGVSKEVEEEIRKVENGLSGWVQIQDSSIYWNIADRMKYYNIHGVSIAVIKNYKIEWARGYGYADTSDKRPVTATTLFQAASISKSLNAMGVLKLADANKISLHENINTYLRSWKFPEDTFTRTTKITAAHLLSHTAGLTVHGFPGYKWTDSIPEDNEILDGVGPANTKAVRSQFAPGVRFQYSGGGTTITKKIIMDVSGEAYDMYMWKQVLGPMGMTNSFYTQPPPPGAFAHLATAYYFNGNPVKGKFHIYPEQAADGLWTTPSDLSRFIIEMQLSMQGKSNKVLSKKMTDTMLTPFIDKSAALGVFIDDRRGQKYFVHDGANVGFRCQYFGSLENGNGVAVMVNSDNGTIIQEIINSVATVYKWKDFYKPAIKKVVRVHADTLKSYEGRYKLGQEIFTITTQGNQLFLKQGISPPIRTFFTTNKDFFVLEVPAELGFQKNEQGVIDAMVIKQGGGTFKAIKQAVSQ
jgi:CubicO group peptidase (beta-lactamase class C family)